MTDVIFFMKRTLIYAVMSALALAIAAGAPARAADTARALKPVTLQLNWKHQFQFAGYYMAIEKGYYRAEGFDIRVVEVQDGRDCVRTAADAEHKAQAA